MSTGDHIVSTVLPRVGVVIRPQVPPEQMVAAAQAAEAAGVDEVWLFEDCFLSGGISAATAVLSRTDSVRVGVGVIPAPMRNVALTAMEIATLHRMYPGRARIGIGHGVQDWMQQIGARVASPMTLLREYLTCLTRLLNGETVTYHGRYVSLERVALDWPPSGAVELLAAATGPKTLQLSGELASGTVITSGTDPASLREACRHIDAGRRLHQAASAHSVAVYVQTVHGEHAETGAREELARWGFDTARLNELAVYGDGAQVANSLRRWVDAGADTVVLQPPADTDMKAFVTFVGTQVRPLL